jgi:hypothetical protein
LAWLLDVRQPDIRMPAAGMGEKRMAPEGVLRHIPMAPRL